MATLLVLLLFCSLAKNETTKSGRMPIPGGKGGGERTTSLLRKESGCMNIRFSLGGEVIFFAFLLSQIAFPDLRGRKSCLEKRNFNWPLKFLFPGLPEQGRRWPRSAIMTPPSLLKGISERKKLNLEITFPSVRTFINQNKILEVNRNRTNKHGQN